MLSGPTADVEYSTAQNASLSKFKESRLRSADVPRGCAGIGRIEVLVPRSNRTRHTVECPCVVAHAPCVSRRGPVAARIHGRTVPQGLNNLTVTVVAPGALPPRDSWAYFSCYAGIHDQPPWSNQDPRAYGSFDPRVSNCSDAREVATDRQLGVCTISPNISARSRRPNCDLTGALSRRDPPCASDVLPDAPLAEEGPSFSPDLSQHQRSGPPAPILICASNGWLVDEVNDAARKSLYLGQVQP